MLDVLLPTFSKHRYIYFLSLASKCCASTASAHKKVIPHKSLLCEGIVLWE